jgi:hypothetical protein
MLLLLPGRAKSPTRMLPKRTASLSCLPPPQKLCARRSPYEQMKGRVAAVIDGSK